MNAAMTRPATELKGRKVLVVGLARTGIAAAKFLAARGAVVTVNDARPEGELAREREALTALGAATVFGAHPAELFRSAELVVVSPGVPLALPVFAQARAAGAEILSEIELAARYLEGTIVAVTGSNGKSTTTSLIGDMLRSSGLAARTCGNIGVPFIDMAAGDGPDSYYALEVSSFQLEAVSAFRPKVAVLTHVTPDHLDRYAGYKEYVAAKARVFAAQGPSDHAVLNALNRDSMELVPSLRARVHLFSSDGPVTDGGYLEGGRLFLAEGGRPELFLAESELPIPGRHNVENVLAAAIACRALGLPVEALRGAARGFRALPHRLERVAEIAGVAWYNDSKATNVDAAAKALASFPGRRVWLILGGKDKGGDFASLKDILRERAAGVLTIGQAATAIEGQIAGTLPILRAGDLGTAVREAARLSSGSGGVVLLAPACASFDQYRNYEERGEHFRRLVTALSEGTDA
jgi:UDP-N-acetylmuramoylalanine--D-glutamate ligase